MHGLFAVALVAFSGLAVQRCLVWRSGETLWTDMTLKYPREKMGFINLARYYSSEGGDPDRALALLDRAFELARDPDDPRMHDVYDSRGNIYFEKGMDQRALEDYDKAIRLAPGFAQSYSNRGAVYGRLQRWGECLSDLNRAVELDPGFLPTYLNRALAYFQMSRSGQSLDDYASFMTPRQRAAGSWEELALADYDVYLRYRPDQGSVYSSRGVVHQRRGDHRSAISDFNTALRYEPNRGQHYYNRSISHASLGMAAEARADALEAQRRGVALDPRYKQRIGL
jgi:tetratricopeptide (TPR) repeat protein